MSDPIEETRFSWEIVNLRTQVSARYHSKIGAPVSAKHALTSPNVLAWLDGDPAKAQAPLELTDASKLEKATHWDVVDMENDAVLFAKFHTPVTATQALETLDTQVWATGHEAGVRHTRYGGLPPIKITSSEGHLNVCRRSGMVLNSTVSENLPESYLRDVVWVDLEDFFNAFPKRDRAKLEEIDILHLAYASDHGEGLRFCESCFHLRAEKLDHNPAYFKA